MKKVTSLILGITLGLSALFAGCGSSTSAEQTARRLTLKPSKIAAP
ncbi:MAG: hypothetical protein LLG02_15065 [Pelosinus sp.]|nr:hypothetical protein [Pelosinus sp.]